MLKRTQKWYLGVVVVLLATLGSATQFDRDVLAASYSPCPSQTEASEVPMSADVGLTSEYPETDVGSPARTIAVGSGPIVGEDAADASYRCRRVYLRTNFVCTQRTRNGKTTLECVYYPVYIWICDRSA